MIGTGYVGLTTGVGFAELGHKVACVDIDQQKIAQLDLGKCPIYEPGLEELLKKNQENGNIVFTTNLSLVIGQAEVIILAVQTPPKANGESNLDYIMKAAEQIGELLDHEAIVIVKSTVPVGTNRKIIECIRKALEENGKSDLTTVVQIASVPEFLREGCAMKDFFKSDRVVIGTDDEIVSAIVEQMHSGIEAPVLKTTLESAELIKSASNAFLATKISFINEMANIAEMSGADVREIAKGVGMDSRIGSKFLQAGIGYGGSCFPKDVSALKVLAGVRGYDFHLLKAVIEVNNKQRELFFKKVQKALSPLKGRRIGVWGITFKPDTDDIRDSASMDIVKQLIAHGADVSVYDPKGMEHARHVLPDHITFAPTPIDAANGADALLVLTEWPEFKDVSFPTLKARMIGTQIFDGRNCLADLHLDQFGFEYCGVGLCT